MNDIHALLAVKASLAIASEGAKLLSKAQELSIRAANFVANESFDQHSSTAHKLKAALDILESMGDLAGEVEGHKHAMSEIRSKDHALWCVEMGHMIAELGVHAITRQADIEQLVRASPPEWIDVLIAAQSSCLTQLSKRITPTTT